MLKRRRTVLLALMVVMLGGVVYTAWLVRMVELNLREAETSMTHLQAEVNNGDETAARGAAQDLRQAAAEARESTDGVWWSALSLMPLLGDDVTGVRAVTRSLDRLASGGVDPLLDTSESLDEVVVDTGVDLDAVSRLSEPISQSHGAAEAAAKEVTDLDSSGYVGRLRGRFDDYVERIESLRSGLESAERVVKVLPGMAGGEGKRRYLLVFQNNAEIRATGGLPGAFAELLAEDGQLSMARQGTAVEFAEREKPVLPLSDAEQYFYGQQLGTYFQDANFTPDFSRAAELMSARWEETYGAELDGVIALDPVALSYLLKGTGPITAAGQTFTSDNLVEGLLNRPYLTLDPAAQDRLFARTARAVFDAATGALPSPLEFVKALQRSADEGRLLVAPFEKADQKALTDSLVLGKLTGDDGPVPHVDIALNDATGSKMSYYLRSGATVRSVGCRSGRQALTGSMRLGSTIDSEEARSLPTSITGGGIHGTDPGSQIVQVRIFGPYGGSIDRALLEGEPIASPVVNMGGRPALRIVALLSSLEDMHVTWQMTTGPGQDKAPELTMTPGMTSGSKTTSVSSSC